MKLNLSLLILILFFPFFGLVSCNGNKTINNTVEVLDKGLVLYHSQPGQFREEFGGTYQLPNVSFFLFGMGNREKYLYKSGKLLPLIHGMQQKYFYIFTTSNRITI